MGYGSLSCREVGGVQPRVRLGNWLCGVCWHLYTSRQMMCPQIRRYTFLSAVGGKTHTLLRSLLSPTLPQDRSYEDIVDTLKKALGAQTARNSRAISFSLAEPSHRRIHRRLRSGIAKIVSALRIERLPQPGVAGPSGVRPVRWEYSEATSGGGGFHPEEGLGVSPRHGGHRSQCQVSENVRDISPEGVRI